MPSSSKMEKVKQRRTNRPPKAPKRGPLEAITIPQKEASKDSAKPGSIVEEKPASTPRDIIQELVLPFMEEDTDKSKFELMQVNITVYKLNGIRCRIRDKSKRNKLIPRVLKKGSKPSATSTTGDSRVSKTTSGDSSNGDTIPAPPMLDTPPAPSPNDRVPTTAVVSYQRNAMSSASAMETFLPSLPMVPTTGAPGVSPRSTRYKANWVVDDCGRTPRVTTEEDMDERTACTFTMVRAMKREAFRPDVKIEEVNNYMHETVDLNVSLGRGRDLFPIGSASLVVTGDEEGEVMMNLPVKPRGTFSSPSSKRNQRRNKERNYFQHDRFRRYVLDDNATLRVGIRVIPQKTAQQVAEAKDSEVKRQKRDLEFIETYLDENADFGACEGDERSQVIAWFDREKRNTLEKDVDTGCAFLTRNGSSDKNEAQRVFCNPMQVYSDMLEYFNALDDSARSDRANKRQPITALVLPTSMLSSVSESTDDDDGPEYLLRNNVLGSGANGDRSFPSQRTEL